MSSGADHEEGGPVAVIVAHGQPSAPEPAEAEAAALAARVGAHLPGWTVRGATLAMPGSLDRAVAGVGAGLRVYPMFMADGWFTATHLPERLRQAGADGPVLLRPFGLDPDVQALAVRLALEAAARAGRAPARTEVLLAAHGSFRSAAPADVARAVAARIARDGGFARVEVAFIDQTPRIATVAAGMAEGTLCLPFFAARGGHVEDDLPQALEEAGFAGQLLDPLGTDPRVPGLIAASLRATIPGAVVPA